MTIEQMFEQLWTQYPADLCKGKRGGRQPAFRAFKKINPDEKEFKRIMDNMKAMIRADRGDKDSYRWPFVSSYLNQARYDDFIISKSMEVESQPLRFCHINGCKESVHGATYNCCSKHIPSIHDDRLREAWKSTGLNRESETLASDCRSYCKEKGYLI